MFQRELLTSDNHRLFCKENSMIFPRRVDTVKQTVITCMEAQRLKGRAASQFIEFNRWRDFYEKQLSEQCNQTSKTNSPTSYKASIEDDDLGVFINAVWIKAASEN